MKIELTNVKQSTPISVLVGQSAVFTTGLSSQSPRTSPAKVKKTRTLASVAASETGSARSRSTSPTKPRVITTGLPSPSLCTIPVKVKRTRTLTSVAASEIESARVRSLSPTNSQAVNPTATPVFSLPPSRSFRRPAAPSRLPGRGEKFYALLCAGRSGIYGP